MDAAHGRTDAKPANTADPRVAESTIRVRTDRLDRLIDMVGVPVIAQSMVTDIPVHRPTQSSQAAAA